VLNRDKLGKRKRNGIRCRFQRWQIRLGIRTRNDRKAAERISRQFLGDLYRDSNQGSWLDTPQAQHIADRIGKMTDQNALFFLLIDSFDMPVQRAASNTLSDQNFIIKCFLEDEHWKPHYLYSDLRLDNPNILKWQAKRIEFANLIQVPTEEVRERLAELEAEHNALHKEHTRKEDELYEMTLEGYRNMENMR